jgi:Integrase core domain
LGPLENVSTAFSSAEEIKSVSPIEWHEQMGHCSMRVVKEMADGAATGIAINDLPENMPTLDNCMACVMSKSKRLPFKTGRTRTKEALELVHGDLAGPMPVESGGGAKYKFVLIDDPSRAGFALPLKAKSDAVDAFGTWLNQVENKTGKRVKMVMFDPVKELTMVRMKELCNRHGMCIITSPLEL